MNDTTDSTPSTPRRRRKSRKGLITVLVLILAAGGWYGFNKYQHRNDDEGGYMYAPVTTGDIEDLVTATGTLEPRDYVDVGAQVSGQIESLMVEVGDVVKKGQVLASIDATTAQARVESNQAQMLSSRTNLENAETNLAKAQRDYQRQVNLKAADATTEEAVLNAKTTLDNAQRSIITSKATIAQQEANMRIEANNLKYTQIIAPIDGTVMTVDVKLGQTINATQQAPKVLRIANLSTMSVKADVSEADVTKLYKGIPVYFTTLGGNNRRWRSTLKRIEPTPKTQQGVVLYTAVFDVENEGAALMPSMTAQVFFVGAEANQVLLVPMAALQQGQQIAREMAQKEREKNGDTKSAAMPGVPGAPGAAGAAPNAAASAGGAAVANAGPAPAAAAAPGAAPAGAQAQPGREGAGGEGTRQFNRAGSGNGQAGGNFNGPRPGGAGGGFNGGQMTPEMAERMRAFRANGGGGNFGGQRPGGFSGMGAAGGTAGASRPAPRRNGIVMVKKADGTLEQRRVVVGVTDRVHGQVIEGLKEGEEVVVAKREAESASAPRTNNNQNNNNQNRPNNFQGGGFPGGGGNFRPF